MNCAIKKCNRLTTAATHLCKDCYKIFRRSVAFSRYSRGVETALTDWVKEVNARDQSRDQADVGGDLRGEERARSA